MIAGAFGGVAGGKSTGGCPSGDDWELKTLEELEIDQASGTPSLDGNGDSLKCIDSLTCIIYVGAS